MKRIQKPIGITVWVIFIVIGYGLFPFFGVIPFAREFWYWSLGVLPFNGSIYILYGPNGEVSFVLILVSLLLCVFSAASAIWANTGQNEGRFSMLTILTLNVSWWIFLVALALLNQEKPGENTFKMIFEIVKPPVYLVFIWWYFTKADVVAYYRQQSAQVT